MKKFLLLALLAVTMQYVGAQDVKKVQTSYILNKIDEAKTEIDKLMADPKSNTKTDVLYWRAKVYAALFKEPSSRAKYPNAEKDANDALQKYIAADPAFAQVKEKGAEPFFDIYQTTFANGIKSFNDKKWENAISDFKSSVEYSDYIFKNKWANASIAFDTTSVLYLAYAYQNANKAAEAAKSYARLAENKVEKVNGEPIMDAYKFLANYYTVNKDEAQFKKYVVLGKEVFPKTFPAEEFEVDYMDHNLSLDEKSAMYDKEDAAGMSEMKYLQFGDIFVNAKGKEKSIDSLTALKYTLKGAEAFKKAYAKNNQNAIAAFNVGIIYYNIFGEYDDTYSYNIRMMQALNTAFADRPVEKDPAKKKAAEAAKNAKLEPFKKANADIEKALMENLDVSLEWLEKSFMILKDKANKSATEKNIQSKSVDFLANLYAYKRDRLKGKDPKAFDAFDAKYKEYDALHGKM